jgi:hypothetical protein
MMNHEVSESRRKLYRRLAIKRESLKLTSYERDTLATVSNPEHAEKMLDYIIRQRAKNAPTM